MHLLLKVVVTFLAITYVSALSFDINDAQCHHFPHCNSCPKDAGGLNSCVECRNHLYGLTKLNGDYPVRCKQCNESSGCHMCKDDTKCDLCIYRTLGPDLKGVGTCSPCSDNCYICGTNGGGKCDRCNEGFFLKDQLCTPCLDNCRRCTDTTSCTYCKRGFHKSPSTPTTCTACIENCDLCYDTTTCDRCFEGYYPKTDKQCTTCPSNNCARCDNFGKCKKCKNGKISENGSCECAAHCSNCNTSGWGKCDDCNPGYKRTAERLCVRPNNN